MSLQIWLPGNGNTKNYGISGGKIETSGVSLSDTNRKTGGSMYFSGSSYILFRNSGLPSGVTNFSIAFFCYITQNNGYHTFYTGRTAIGTGISVFWNDGHFRFDDGSSSGSSYQHTFSDYNTPLNTWIHVCLTRGSGKKKLYINGVLQQTINTKAPEAVTAASHIASLGLSCATSAGSSTPTFSTNPLRAYISDYRIYDHTLSLKEVREISKGLVCHIPLSEYPRPNILGALNISNWVEDGVHREMSTSSGAMVLSNLGSGQQRVYFLTTNVWTSGVTYTVSCDVRKTSGSPKIRFSRSLQNDSSTTITPTDAWTHVSCQIACTSTVSDGTLSLRYVSSSTGTVEIKNIKFERGATETAYTDSTSTPNLEDLSGFSNSATPVWSNTALPATTSDTPRGDKAIVLSGNAYLRLPSLLKLQDAITVSIWAYSSDWASLSGTNTLISCTEGGGWNMTIYTNQTHGKNFYFEIMPSDSSSYLYGTSNPNVNALSSGWHHFVGTWDGYTMCSYIDGELWNATATASVKKAIKYNTSNSLLIGAEPGRENTAQLGYWNNRLSDLRIYATALSGSDVKELYKGTVKLDRQGRLYTANYQETPDTSGYKMKKTQILSGPTLIERPQTDLGIIYFEGAYWLRVLRHSNPASGALFTQSNALRTIESRDLYSRLADITNFHTSSGVFEFLFRQKPLSTDNLVWGRWTQTSDPTVSTTLSGYTYVSGTASGSDANLWGLVRKDSGSASSSGKTALAVPGSGYWYSACGSWTAWNGGIPGFAQSVIKTGFMELYVRVDGTVTGNLESLPSLGTGFPRFRNGTLGTQVTELYEL